MEDKKYCVYLHRRKDNNDIVYVGEGRLARAKNTRLDKSKNKKHQEIVQTVGVYYEIYADNLTKVEAEKLEENLITELKKAGHNLTNFNKKTTAAIAYKREDFVDLFYIDPTSPSGLRWKTDRPNIPNGHLLAKKGDAAGCKKKGVGQRWYYNNKATHRIVYALVHGECPADMTVDHIDCNLDNNSIENLQLLTRNENSSKGSIYKKINKGEDVFGSKITNSQIIEIYQMFENFRTNKEIAEKYNLHERYVSLIRHGKRWESFYKEYGKVFPESYTEKATSYDQLKEVLYLLSLNLTNKDISEATRMEVSTVSRVRHGKLFIQLIERINNETTFNL